MFDRTTDIEISFGTSIHHSQEVEVIKGIVAQPIRPRKWRVVFEIISQTSVRTTTCRHKGR